MHLMFKVPKTNRNRTPIHMNIKYEKTFCLKAKHL